MAVEKLTAKLKAELCDVRREHVTHIRQLLFVINLMLLAFYIGGEIVERQFVEPLREPVLLESDELRTPTKPIASILKV